MELAAQLEDKNWRLEMQWSPRELNSEADALSNGDHAGFDPKRRVHLDLSQVKWKVLDKLMAHGLAFQAERNARRKKKKRRTKASGAD